MSNYFGLYFQFWFFGPYTLLSKQLFRSHMHFQLMFILVLELFRKKYRYGPQNEIK